MSAAEIDPVEVIRGGGPLVLGIPHTGAFVPEAIWARLNDRGRALTDTDWHVHRLYAGLSADATTVRATFHRYVVDANRDPAGASLYPGQNTTTLCPTTDFDGLPIYRDGAEPNAQDIDDRRRAWHAVYHAALAAEIDRVRAAHGVAILYDCHSIRSVAPFLFAGALPDFNIGDNDGATCAAAVRATVEAVVRSASGYSWVTNGRFKGGWTTRRYGQPERGVHAIQMELSQATHLRSEAHPFDYDAEKADRLRVALRTILQNLEALAPSLATDAPIRA